MASHICIVQCYFGVIRSTCLKMAHNLKRAVVDGLIEFWDSGVVVTLEPICGTSDHIVFRS